MKKMFFVMLAMSLAVFGSEAWEAIVMPKASLLFYCGEKAIAKGEQENENNKEKENRPDMFAELYGAERSEIYEAMLNVLEEIEKSPAVKKNVKTFRLCDSFDAKNGVAVAMEFKNPVSLDALKSIPDSKLSIAPEKVSGLDVLGVKADESAKCRFAVVLADEGKVFLMTAWEQAASLLARIGKDAQYTPEMKHLLGSVKGDMRTCVEISDKIKQKINEKAMAKMSESPMHAMAMMKLAEMNGVLIDGYLKEDGASVRFGLSGASAQAAKVVKEQLLDGMVLPMSQSLAEGIAPGKINTQNMLKSSVEGKNAILNIELKDSDIETFKNMGK